MRGQEGALTLLKDDDPDPIHFTNFVEIDRPLWQTVTVNVGKGQLPSSLRIHARGKSVSYVRRLTQDQHYDIHIVRVATAARMRIGFLQTGEASSIQASDRAPHGPLAWPATDFEWQETRTVEDLVAEPFWYQPPQTTPVRHD